MEPTTPQNHDPIRTKRPRQFKMRLTEHEADQLKKRAHAHELSQADFVRILTFGQTEDYNLPDTGKLQAIYQQLAGIATNLNQAQHSINVAQQEGKLTADQLAAMYKAIAEGRRLWTEPLNELRGQLSKLKPNGVDADR